MAAIGKLERMTLARNKMRWERDVEREQFMKAIEQNSLKLHSLEQELMWALRDTARLDWLEVMGKTAGILK